MINSQPFLSMSISVPTPILQIRLFDTLTLNYKIKVMGEVKGQGHIVHSHGHERSTHSPFFPCQSVPPTPIPQIRLFEILTLNYKVKVMGEVKGQGQIVHPVSNWYTYISFHINRTNHFWDISNRVFDLEETHPKFSKKICQKKGFWQNSSNI